MIGPFKIDLTKPRCWRDAASNADAWERWDRAWRRRFGWRAGLTFWGRTNVPGSRTLLARHWPHRLCWSWSVRVGTWRRGYDGQRRVSLVILRRYRSATLWLWGGYISLHWQDSDWMVALGPYRADAPTIYWKHHLENAQPAGSA